MSAKRISTEPERSYVRVYDPRLVPLIGAHGAMAFGQIKWLLELPNSGRDYDGHHWIWKSYDDLGHELGLSRDQVKRALITPREIGLIVSIRNPIHGWDSTPWYRIAYDHEFIQQANSPEAEGESAQCRGESASLSRRIRPIEQVDPPGRVGGSARAIPESTSLDPPVDIDQKDSSTDGDRARDSLIDIHQKTREDTARPKSTVPRGARQWQQSKRPTSPTVSDNDVSATTETPSEPQGRWDDDERQTVRAEYREARERAELEAEEESTPVSTSEPEPKKPDPMAELRGRAAQKLAAKQANATVFTSEPELDPSLAEFSKLSADEQKEKYTKDERKALRQQIYDAKRGA